MDTHAILCSLPLLATQANCAVVGFVSNPSGNSTDWATFVLGEGGTINSNVNFDSHPTGTLQGNFYQVSDGVTLTPSGAVGNVTFGQGPNDGNTTGSQPAEGTHPASNYLTVGSGFNTLTISFDQPVIGAGLSTIDLFQGETLNIAAYSGPSGTGSLLGSFDSTTGNNYQPNNVYFMGIGRNEGDIRSIVFTDNDGGTGDNVGLDDIVFATSPIPEPSGVLALSCLLLSSVFFRNRSR